MVMQDRSGSLSVEEARRLGPPTAEQVARSRQVLARAAARREAALAGGRHILSADEILWALGRTDEGDDDCDRVSGADSPE